HSVGEDAQRNRIAYASLNTPYRAHTVWNTVYEAYFTETGDPRVAWEDTGMDGDAAIECCGRVPFYRQLKHSASDSPIRLSSGRAAQRRLAERRRHHQRAARGGAGAGGLRRERDGGVGAAEARARHRAVAGGPPPGRPAPLERKRRAGRSGPAREAERERRRR